MTQNTALLKAFARVLATPGCQVRALAVREPVPALKLAPGDVVVFETGRTWPEGETWLVVRRWQQRQFSFTQSASPEEVRGRLLFTVHETDP
jgi:hypothetical protein